MEKKIVIKVLSFSTLVIFIPIIIGIFILRKSARDGYCLSKSTLLKYRSEFKYSLAIKILEAAEDHRYQLHFGIDPIAILRAIRNNIVKQRLEGASTIEQQYVRTCTGKRDITAMRKLEELSISILLSISHSKNDIAYSYISLAYFGEGLHGIQRAILQLWPDEDIHNDQYRLAAIIAMLKRPRPLNINPKWELSLQHRTDYIIKRYFTLIENHAAP